MKKNNVKSANNKQQNENTMNGLYDNKWEELKCYIMKYYLLTETTYNKCIEYISIKTVHKKVIKRKKI